jgi:hypothetical protein
VQRLFWLLSRRRKPAQKKSRSERTQTADTATRYAPTLCWTKAARRGRDGCRCWGCSALRRTETRTKDEWTETKTGSDRWPLSILYSVPLQTHASITKPCNCPDAPTSLFGSFCIFSLFQPISSPYLIFLRAIGTDYVPSIRALAENRTDSTLVSLRANVPDGTPNSRVSSEQDNSTSLLFLHASYTS